MKILDYEGLKQVVSKIKGLIDKKADKVDLENLDKKSKFIDTREKNENPEFYIKNYPQNIVREFKRTSVMGLSGKLKDAFCYVITVFGWANLSGGNPCQYSISSNGADIYYRVGISNTKWSSWRRVLDDTDLKTKLSQLSQDSTHRLVTDAEKTKWNNKAEKSYVDDTAKGLENAFYVLSEHFETKIKQLESAMFEDITGNPFTINFKDIKGLTLTSGVYNEARARLEC